MLNPLNEPYDEGNRPSWIHPDVWRDGRDQAREWAQTPALPRDVPVWDDFESNPVIERGPNNSLFNSLWCAFAGFPGTERYEQCRQAGRILSGEEEAAPMEGPLANVQDWFVRGGFIAVGLVMLTIGLAVIATGADPLRSVRSNVKATVEGR